MKTATESSTVSRKRTGRIVVAGGSGFLGRTLTAWYAKQGRELTVLSRRPVDGEGARTVAWDGENLGDWVDALDGADALINLAGRSVNCRYHARNRREIMDSRVLSTRVLGRAMRECASPPPVWLNASTATIYKHTYGAPHDEANGTIEATAEAKDAFSIEVARAWEQEFADATLPATRKIVMRTALVLGNEPGGVFPILRRLTRCFLGGPMAGGRPYVSWIHAEDFCRAVDWLMTEPGADGVYNLCSPNPVPNSELMAALQNALGVPFGLPATRWMLAIGAFVLRTETELLIKSRRVAPARLLAEGFAFRHPDLEEAIADLAAV